MARRTFEAQLELVESLRKKPPQEALPELERMLRHKNNLLVARAAEVAVELGIDALFPSIEGAFFRFLQNGAETDKTCRAKTAIVRALLAANHRADEVCLAGIAHVQLEPAWGPPEDTAVELRCLCADALVRLHVPDVVEKLAILLADKERGPRAAAARAIGDTGRREGVAVLELKVLIGDPDPEVLTEAFASLLRLAQDTVAFVEPFLTSADPALAESAALAFGEARIDGTENILIDAAERQVLGRKVLYLALAMMRTKAAIDHLLGKIEGGSDGEAKAAIEALEIFRHDQALMARVTALMEARASD